MAITPCEHETRTRDRPDDKVVVFLAWALGVAQPGLNWILYNWLKRLVNEAQTRPVGRLVLQLGLRGVWLVLLLVVYVLGRSHSDGWWLALSLPPLLHWAESLVSHTGLPRRPGYALWISRARLVLLTFDAASVVLASGTLLAVTEAADGRSWWSDALTMFHVEWHARRLRRLVG